MEAEFVGLFTDLAGLALEVWIINNSGKFVMRVVWLPSVSHG